MTNLFKKQKIGAAMKLLQWQYEKQGIDVPDFKILQKQAEKLVDDAGKIASERGKNVLSILKEMVVQIQRK